MTEENDPTRRRSRSHQELSASRSQRKQQQQEEHHEEIGVEGEQELGGESDDDRDPRRRSRSHNSSLRQSRRRQNRSLRNSNPDADGIPGDQPAQSKDSNNLTRTNRLRNRRSANAGIEDRESRSRSGSRRGLDGKERRSSPGPMNTSSEKRPSFGSIVAGTDLGLLENSQRSHTDRSYRSLVDRVDSVASDENFLQERKSRQDAILGQVLGDYRKTGEDDPSKSTEVEEETEKPKSRPRRPSLTRLSDARKRVQERMAKRSSGSSNARDAAKDIESGEEGEMVLKDDYDARLLEDRQKTTLVDRVSNVVSTPEKTKRKVVGTQSPKIASPLVIIGNKSNWDL